jgi:hypothetical protein
VNQHAQMLVAIAMNWGIRLVYKRADCMHAFVLFSGVHNIFFYLKACSG